MLQLRDLRSKAVIAWSNLSLKADGILLCYYFPLLENSVPVFSLPIIICNLNFFPDSCVGFSVNPKP
jgi:hypothetical protein